MEPTDKELSLPDAQAFEKKAPYVSPQLVRYGTLAELTRGAAGQFVDGARKTNQQTS
jgi:hypothetical protein